MKIKLSEWYSHSTFVDEVRLIHIHTSDGGMDIPIFKRNYFTKKQDLLFPFKCMISFVKDFPELIKSVR